jgi:hypothetical protein
MHIVIYLRQMAAHVNAFLKNFYAVFPEMQIVDVRDTTRYDIVEMTNLWVRLTSPERVLRAKTSLTLVSKVSYVLNFTHAQPADAILKTTLISTPLKGIAIGNGWFDGRSQYPAYYEFAINAGVIRKGSQVRCTSLLPEVLSDRDFAGR